MADIYTIGCGDGFLIKEIPTINSGVNTLFDVNANCYLADPNCTAVKLYNNLGNLVNFCIDTAGNLFNTISHNQNFCVDTHAARMCPSIKDIIGGCFNLKPGMCGGSLFDTYDCLYTGIIINHGNNNFSNVIPTAQAVSIIDVVRKVGVQLTTGEIVGAWYDSVIVDDNTAWLCGSGGYVAKVYCCTNCPTVRYYYDLFYVPGVVKNICPYDCKFPVAFAMDMLDTDRGAVAITSSEPENGLYIISNASTTPVFTHVAASVGSYITGISCKSNGDVVFTDQDGVKLYSASTGTISSLYTSPTPIFTLADICAVSTPCDYSYTLKGYINLHRLKGKDTTFVVLNNLNATPQDKKVIRVQLVGSSYVVDTYDINPPMGILTIVGYNSNTFGLAVGTTLTYYNINSANTLETLGVKDYEFVPFDLDSCVLSVSGFKLTNCKDNTDIIYTDQDLSSYVNKVVTLENCYGACYVVEAEPDISGKTLQQVVIKRTYDSCNLCLGIEEIPPPTFKIRRESYRPGLDINDCDYDYVSNISTKYASFAYKEMIKNRYKVNYCCYTDLSKYIIKYEMLKMQLAKGKFECCPIADCIKPCVTLEEPPLLMPCLKPSIIGVTLTDRCANLADIISVQMQQT